MQTPEDAGRPSYVPPHMRGMAGGMAGAKEVQSRGANRRYSIMFREPRRYRAEVPAEDPVLYTGSQGDTEQRSQQMVKYYIEWAKEEQSRGASRWYSIMYREPRRYRAEEPAEGTVLYTGIQGGTEQRSQQKVHFKYSTGSQGGTEQRSQQNVQYYIQGAKEGQSRGATRRYSIIHGEPRRYRAEEPPEGTVLYTGSQGGSEQRRQQKFQFNCIFRKLWRYRVSGR